MIIIILIKIFLILLLILVDIVLFRTIVRGAPFATTTQKALQTMMDLAQVRPGEKAVDIGSGDGRVVIALAKAGADAHGYEINPLLVWWSRRKIQCAGVEKNAHIHQQSFWEVNMQQFSLVTIFGMSHFMRKLGIKLQKELPLNARIVCNTFRLPQWRPIKDQQRVYLYKKS